MTSQQMIKLFQEILAVTAKEIGIAYTQVDTDTILNYLNEAQQKLFYEKYLSGGLQTALSSVNQNIQELNKLIVTKSAALSGVSSVYNKAYILNLEDNAVFPIKVIATATNTIIGNTPSKLPCNVINYQSIDRYLTNGYNIPIILKPVYLFNYGGTEIDFSLTDILSFVWSNPVISQTTEENSNNSQEISFIWDNFILTQIDSTNFGETLLQFNWSNYVIQQLNDIESQSILLDFVWSGSINSQIEDSVEEILEFTWSNNIITQIEDTNIEVLHFIWSDSIQTQVEDVVLETLSFNWSSPIYTQSESLDTTILEFVWSDNIKTQISEEYLETSLEFIWTNPITTQIEDNTLETLLNFTWTVPILTQVEEPDFIGLDFEWSGLLWAETEDINMDYTSNLDFVWSDLINVQSEERLPIELISFVWSTPVLAELIESSAELLGFEWGRLELSQINETGVYNTVLGFTWEDELLFQSEPTPILSATWTNPVAVQVEIINSVKEVIEEEIPV